MSPAEALALACREAKDGRFEYRSGDADGPWKGRTVMEQERHGVCRDFAAWACERAYDLAAGRYRLVVGDARWPTMLPGDDSGVSDVVITQSGRHAWVAVFVDGAELWGDATPGWPSSVTPWSEWDRTALWGYDFDGTVFATKEEYEP